ncbi:hypothetical protein V7x_00080 [Crateriforma conspicua]|uniref:Uncharacterized protein n=1 Tax=Crateriforma conspicua TaxID=2527996 RepID=A0A5C6FSG8_9PLAN|nr:hypothetical protein V7x_00080 [Crateriforma conspicua]
MTVVHRYRRCRRHERRKTQKFGDGSNRSYHRKSQDSLAMLAKPNPISWPYSSRGASGKSVDSDGPSPTLQERHFGVAAERTVTLFCLERFWIATDARAFQRSRQQLSLKEESRQHANDLRRRDRVTCSIRRPLRTERRSKCSNQSGVQIAPRSMQQVQIDSFVRW